MAGLTLRGNQSFTCLQVGKIRAWSLKKVQSWEPCDSQLRTVWVCFLRQKKNVGEKDRMNPDGNRKKRKANHT